MIAIDEWSWLKNRLHAERVEAKEMIMAAGWYAIAKRIVTRTTKETLTLYKQGVLKMKYSFSIATGI